MYQSKHWKKPKPTNQSSEFTTDCWGRLLPRKQPWIREQGSEALPKGDSEQPRRLLRWRPVLAVLDRGTEEQLPARHHPLCGHPVTSEEPVSDMAAGEVSWGPDPSYIY